MSVKVQQDHYCTVAKSLFNDEMCNQTASSRPNTVRPCGPGKDSEFHSKSDRKPTKHL